MKQAGIYVSKAEIYPFNKLLAKVFDSLQHTFTTIQAPIGACRARPGESRQSDTRLSDANISAIKLLG